MYAFPRSDGRAGKHFVRPKQMFQRFMFQVTHKDYLEECNAINASPDGEDDQSGAIITSKLIIKSQLHEKPRIK